MWCVCARVCRGQALAELRDRHERDAAESSSRREQLRDALDEAERRARDAEQRARDSEQKQREAQRALRTQAPAVNNTAELAVKAPRRKQPWVFESVLESRRRHVDERR